MSVYFLNLFSKIIESSEILFIFVKENYSSIMKLEEAKRKIHSNLGYICHQLGELMNNGTSSRFAL